LAGWLARRLLAALAAALEDFASLTDSAARLADRGERLAVAREAAPAAAARVGTPAAPPEAGSDDSRTRALAEIRLALRQGHWAHVEALIQSFSVNHPDDQAAVHLGNELTDAKRSAIAALRARVEAAQQANDEQRVIEIHAELSLLLTPDERAATNRRLARWFMHQIQKRLRQGVMTTDLALLAARVAEVFDSTPEGASLRAALPTLRRSAGLCARCGQPYTGLADACPKCLAALSVPIYPPPERPPSSNGDSLLPSERHATETSDVDPE
jgi:hypothetical protein